MFVFVSFVRPLPAVGIDCLYVSCIPTNADVSYQTMYGRILYLHCLNFWWKLVKASMEAFMEAMEASMEV